MEGKIVALHFLSSFFSPFWVQDPNFFSYTYLSYHRNTVKNILKSIEYAIASLKRGQKGKQRIQRRNNFSFAIQIVHAQLNQFYH